MADDRNGGGGFGWFILGGLVGLAVGAYIATGPGREQVGLAEPQRRQAEEVPELAQGEAQSRHQQRRDVSAPAIRQESKTELGDDQDEQHGHDEAGGDQLHLPISPSVWLRQTPPHKWGGRLPPRAGGGLS